MHTTLCFEEALVLASTVDVPRTHSATYVMTQTQQAGLSLHTELLAFVSSEAHLSISATGGHVPTGGVNCETPDGAQVRL